MRTILIPSILLALGPAGAAAQAVPDWYPWHNEVVPTVELTGVEVDPVTGDFAYAYAVANGPAALQTLEALYLELAVAPAGMASPVDWQVIQPGDPGVAVFFAGGEIDPAWVPAHDGDLPRFLSDIPPGGRLDGFVVRSVCASGTGVTFFARGYNHFPSPPEDDDSDWIVIPDWREDAVRGEVGGPGDCDVVADWGNRRPGVDGFVGLVNFASGAALPAGPVTVQLRFSRNGETVDPATLQVELNRVDVTAAFRFNTRGDAVAAFDPADSPLASGRNVLLVSVDGIVPGTTRTATDADRFTFTIP